MEKMRTIFGSAREATPMPATFAGRYLVESAVAGGTVSVVWRAKELSSDTPVALKFFSPQLVRDPAELAAVQALIRTAQGTSHPGVVASREIVVVGKYAAIVTPWLDGVTLRQMLEARPAHFFEVDDLRRWLRGLIHCLEAAHAVDFVHGALNPDVVVQQAGEIRVVGWGGNAWLRRVSKATARDDALAYHSPAQRRGEIPRASDDVYAVGVLTYHLLTGTPPDAGRGQRPGRPLALAEQRRKNGLRGGEIPTTWEQVIRRCLEPHERDRIGSMRELRVRLDLGPSATPASVAPSTIPVSAPEPRAAAVHVSAPPPVRTTSRPPLRGDSPLPSANAPRQSPPVGAEPARVHRPALLRGLFVLVSLATLVVGGWLTWQTFQRSEMLRAMVGGLGFNSSMADAAPVPEPAPVVPTAPVVVERRDPLPATVEEAVSLARVSDIEPPIRSEQVPPPRALSDIPPEASPPVTTVAVSTNSTAPLVSPDEKSPDGDVADDDVVSALPSEEATAHVSDDVVLVAAGGPPLDGGIFELGTVDVAPHLIERVDPLVPRRHFRQAESGRVELVVVIDRMGRVASASLDSTTDESLVAPSLQAVRLWRFTPASKRGQAVPVRVAVPLVFQAL